MTKRSPLKQAAIAAGLSWYWPGKPCKYGHWAEWNVSGGCRICRRNTASQWQQANPERALELVAAYRQTDKHRTTRAVWVAANADRLRIQSAEKEKRHRRNKTNRALSAALSCRFRAVLKGRTKHESVRSLLGCSLDEFRAHIESLWTPGMDWYNWTRDGWHIDHIRPCSSFDLALLEEQKKCFHYSNMQPLWAVDNLKKGNRLVSGEITPPCGVSL